MEREIEGLKAGLASFQGSAESRAELEAAIETKTAKQVGGCCLLRTLA